jgi:Coenzyme PQQ synthesis protein D (PqqD)
MLQLSENLRATTDREGGILLDLARGRLFRCNASGAAILELLLRGCDEAQIEREFAERFGLSAEQASSDVREFLSALRGNGLVRERKPE